MRHVLNWLHVMILLVSLTLLGGLYSSLLGRPLNTTPMVRACIPIETPTPEPTIPPNPTPTPAPTPTPTTSPTPTPCPG